MMRILDCWNYRTRDTQKNIALALNETGTFFIMAGGLGIGSVYHRMAYHVNNIDSSEELSDSDFSLSPWSFELTAEFLTVTSMLVGISAKGFSYFLSEPKPLEESVLPAKKYVNLNTVSDFMGTFCLTIGTIFLGNALSHHLNNQYAEDFYEFSDDFDKSENLALGGVYLGIGLLAKSVPCVMFFAQKCERSQNQSASTSTLLLMDP